eukprot:1147844-Pelagomonas_calceolata.AAC.5
MSRVAHRRCYFKDCSFRSDADGLGCERPLMLLPCFSTQLLPVFSYCSAHYTHNTCTGVLEPPSLNFKTLVSAATSQVVHSSQLGHDPASSPLLRGFDDHYMWNWPTLLQRVGTE